MKEIRSIIGAYQRAREKSEKCALATVVQVEGSAYRRPGARMLIDEKGRLTGAISGGCLEGDALRKALHVMAEKRATLVVYDTMDEDDALLGVGLGCNGIIRILIEPIDYDDPENPVEILKKATKTRQNAVILTVFSIKDRKAAQLGTCFLALENDRSGWPAFGGNLEKEIAHAFETQKSGWPFFEKNGEAWTAFVEFVPPEINLVIVGAGNDVMPLVEMADILGWETTVVDGRANYAKKERFARACQVLLAKPEEVLGKTVLDDRSFFALMTHNYTYDKAILLELCRKNARFVAMLGPKKKLARMLEEWESEGAGLSESQLACIRSPAGLDIGAETPEEIALSIIAEMQAFLRKRNSGPLREKATAIH